jgi:hypothetical protein
MQACKKFTYYNETSGRILTNPFQFLSSLILEDAMPIFENRGSYLFVKVIEPYSLKLALALLQEFSERCKQEHLDKALVDGLMLEGPISIWDRYQVGEEFVRVVGPTIKVALVAKPDLINLTMENVVVNRIGRLKVFDEMESALEWLGVGE